jgi:hypothetical protein
LETVAITGTVPVDLEYVVGSANPPAAWDPTARTASVVTTMVGLSAMGLSASVGTGNWQSEIGGFHEIRDAVVFESGTIWAVGSGIVSGGQGSELHVTDWGEPWYVYAGLAVSESGTGWILANPALFGDSLPPPFIGEVRSGVLVERYFVPDIWHWRDIVMTAADDVWAVGSRSSGTAHVPVMFHFDGNEWSDYSPSADIQHPDRDRRGHLVAIEQIDADYYALAEEGDVWRWDGARWALNATLAGVPPLYDLAMRTPDDFRVVGGAGSRWIGHVTGGDVTVELDAPGDALYSIAMVNDRAWAVGDSGAIIEYGDGVWRLVDSTNPYMIFRQAWLWHVTTVPHDTLPFEAVAVGMAGQIVGIGESGIDFLHPKDGDRVWSAAVDGQNRLWLGGYRCEPVTCMSRGDGVRRVPMITSRHFGLSWDSLFNQFAGAVYDLAVAPDGDVIAVGGGATGNPMQPESNFILRYSGSEWRTELASSDVTLRSVGVSAADDTWAVGSNGRNDADAESAVWSDHSGAWSIEERFRATDLDVLVVNRDGVWLGGSETAPLRQAVLWHRTGDDWSRVALPGRSVLALASTPSGVLWTIVEGDEGDDTFYSKRGAQWSVVQDSPVSAASYRIGFVSDDEGYAGTGQGRVLRWNGREWVDDFVVANPSGGFMRFVDFVPGTSDDDDHVVAVADPYTVMRRELHGSAWRVYVPHVSR